MTLLIAFNLSHFAILLMYAAKPERLAATSISVSFSSKWLHLPAYCLLLVSLYFVAKQYGWEIGIPIFLAMLMVIGAVIVTLMTLIPKSASVLIAVNLLSLVIGVWLILM